MKCSAPSFRSLLGRSIEVSDISEKLASILENCSRFDTLRKLHASIFTFGLRDNIFLGTKLLNSYAKFGFLAESRWVFGRIINDNISLWSSVLAGYFRTGHYGEVLERYSDLRRRKIGLEGSAITFCVKSCADLRWLEFGQQVHVDAIRFGLNADGFVGSALIGFYSSCGDIKGASKAFDEIAHRDVVAYTTIISGYSRLGDHGAYKAFPIARHMQEEQIEPNRVTLVSLLQAAAELGELGVGRSIHGYAFKRSIGWSDEVFETSLINMYSRCGALKVATCIFLATETTNVGTWNAVIAGHLHASQPLEALLLFYRMVQEHVLPDLITLANGILSCADLTFFREGKSIHGYIYRTKSELDLIATTALIDFYSTCNRLKQAMELFETTERKDAVMFNVLMAGHLQNGFSSKAVVLFSQMFRTNIVPNLASLLTVLSALGDLEDIRHGMSVHGYVIKQGLDCNTELSNQLISMYGSSGFLIYAGKVFNELQSWDTVSWTSLMTGYVNHGQAEEAIALFRLMQREKFGYDMITLISLVQAFSQLGYLHPAKEIHGHLYRVLEEIEEPVVNSLVCTYARCGRLDMARVLFQNLELRSLASWNTIISACGMHGHSAEALQMYERLKKEKLKPDEVTFSILLTMCSHSGLVKEGLHIFTSMFEEYSVIPNEDHYSCVIDLLSRAGCLEEAYDLVKSPQMRQNPIALRSLIAACRAYGDREKGEALARQVLSLESSISTAHSLMANVYADGQKWDDLVRIRSNAAENGVKKTPGYSLIEQESVAA